MTLTTTLSLSSPIARTPRVIQLESLFDIAPAQRSEHKLEVKLDLPDDWSIGLIVGPSGCGKSRTAADLGIKDITKLLSSVGFSSPPASEGAPPEQSLVVIDEFTSVVDRTVAKIASCAIAKTVRRRKQRFIALSCHYDIVPWLAPDWIYQPHIGKLELPRGSLRRPHIELEIRRVHQGAWSLFKHHHYLTAALWKTLGYRAYSCTGHPAEMQSRPLEAPVKDVSGNRGRDGKPVERIRLVCAADCEPCHDCGEPFCVVCQQHYADCACVGPGNADELGYDVIEENGNLYGVKK